MGACEGMWYEPWPIRFQNSDKQPDPIAGVHGPQEVAKVCTHSIPPPTKKVKLDTAEMGDHPLLAEDVMGDESLSDSTLIIDEDDSGAEADLDQTSTSPLMLNAKTSQSNAKTPQPKRSFDEVCTPFTPAAPKKTKATAARRPMLQLFRWKWLDRVGEVVTASPFWFLKEATCRNEADYGKPVIGKNLVLEIENKEEEKPAMKTVMSKLIVHALTTEIRDMAKSRCMGCLYDCNGQRPHMDGCLQDWEGAVDKYFDDCKGVTNTTATRHWLRNVMDGLGYPIHLVESMIEGWNSDVDEHDLKEELLNKGVDDTFQNFFDEVQPKKA